MKLLTAKFIREFAANDQRIDGIDILPFNQIAVWLDPKYTWCANDGNRTVNHYEIEGSDYQDKVKTFLDDVKMIELAVDWAK